MTASLWTRLRWPILFLALAGLWLLPVLARPDGFPFWVGGEYSDLLISHWPNAEFLRRALLQYHQFPLWNPSILSGAPFAADPLAGLWYPPDWLTVILPLPFAFNLLLVPVPPGGQATPMTVAPGEFPRSIPEMKDPD